MVVRNRRRRHIPGTTAEYPEAFGAQRPAGRLDRNAPAGPEHLTGDGDFVGWGADVGAGVVQHQILEVNEFAVDPQRGAGNAEMHALDPPRPDRGTGDALVEPH